MHPTPQLQTSLQPVDALRAALDEHAMVVVTDAGGRITEVNDKFCAISQYSREELIGQDHRLMNSRHHATEFMRGLWATIERGEVWRGEIKNQAKDGTFYWVDTTIVPSLDEQGRARQYFAFRSDITERKRAEAENQRLNRELELQICDRTAQLEAANQELEAFSFSVSHDLRTPLRALDGFSHAVLEDCGPLLTPNGQRQLQVIRHSAQKMGALIDDLLAFSRLNRQPLLRHAVNASSLVSAAMADALSQRGGSKPRFELGELPVCQADGPLLKQVWVNLISNAVKFTGKREHAVVVIGCNQIRGVDTFFIRDNGAGFDLRYAGKLFGVFQRLHREEDFPGAGIGLAIVKRIVVRHGGRIWADAAPERGATFYFTLERDPQL